MPSIVGRWLPVLLLVSSLLGGCASSSAAETATVSAGASSVSLSTGDPVVADGIASLQVSVRVVDQAGLALAGQRVDVLVSGSGNTVVTDSPTTDITGVVSATLTSIVAEEKVIRALINPGPNEVMLASQPTVRFIGDASNIDAALSEISATTDIIADGVQVSTITVVVRDINANPVAGQSMRVAATGMDNTLVQPSAATDDEGAATATLASTRAEVKIATALINPGPNSVSLAGSAAATFLGDPNNLDPLLSTVEADVVEDIVANGSDVAMLTVLARDVNANPVRNVPVLVTVTGSGNTFEQPGPTDTSGATTVAIASTRAEQKSVTVTLDPGKNEVILAEMPTIVFVGDPDAVSATLSRVEASPASGLIANGSDQATVTVTVLDVNQNPVAGLVVAVAASGSGNVIEAGPPTDAQGRTAALLRSTSAETKVISATVSPGGGQVLLAEMPGVTFEADPSTISAGLSSADAAPTTVLANGTDETVITVVVRDANNNPVPGQNVRVTSSGLGNSITQPPGPTDASGRVVARMSSSVAEVKTLTLRVNPGPGSVVLDDRPQVTFTADAGSISSSNSTVDAAPSVGIIADGVDASLITIVVRDFLNNPVPLQTVVLSSSAPGDVFEQPGLTGADGSTLGRVRTTSAGMRTITATVNPGATQVVLDDRPVLSFVGDPNNISASLSTLVADPTSDVVADGMERTTLTVRVLDVNANPVAGQVVSLSSSGTLNTFVQPGPTDAQGFTTGTLASTRAETKLIGATVNPGPAQVNLTGSASVGFIADAGNISASLSTATATPDSGLVADGVDSSTIRVTVRDANGNPVPGQSVLLAADGSGNVLQQPGTTNANGVANGMLASTSAELKTLTVSVNPGPAAIQLDDQPTVQFDGDPGSISASLSSASASPTSGVIADGVDVTVVSVTVVDVNGNPVAGQAVQLSSDGSNNVFGQPAPTDAAGRTSGTLASTTAELKRITVTVNPGASQVVLADSPSVRFVGDPSNISTTLSSATANPTTGLVADGVDESTINVTVRDVNGNPVSGQVVRLAATGSGNVLTQPPVSGTTGVALGAIASTVAEQKTITVTVNPGPGALVLAMQPTVIFGGDPSSISATLSSVVAAPTSVVADGSDTTMVTVVVRDVNGNRLPNQLVSLAVSGQSNSINQPGLTDGSGTALGDVSSIRAQQKSIVATVNPGANQVVLADQPVVQFIGDASNISTSLSTLVANPSANIVADGVQISTLSVVVVDANGNVLPGLPVQLSSTGTQNTLGQPAPTDVTGRTSGTLASTRAEQKLVSATVDPGGAAVVLDTMPTVDFIADAGAISASLSEVTVNPPTGVIADGNDTSIVRVTVRDVNGNPVPGQAVRLGATGSSNTLMQPAPSNALGETAGTIASTVAEPKVLTVTVNPGANGVTLTTQPSVEFVGDPATISASLSTAGANPAVDVVANGVALSTISVVVRDANNNPVAGQVVRLASTGSNNTLTQPGTTDATGATSGTIASLTAELKTLTVTVNPGPSSVQLTTQPTVRFIGDAANLSAALSSAVAQPPSGVVADGVDSSNIRVTVRDVNANPVPAQVVLLGASGTGNTLTQPGETNQNGVTNGSIASTVAETKTIIVTVNPGPGGLVLNAMPTVSFDGDPGSISSSLSSVDVAPATGVVADGIEVSTITVVVRDTNGNPLAGQDVLLASSGGQNVLTQPGLTDATGTAQGSLASTRAQVKTITATVNPGAGQVLLADQPTIEFVGDVDNISASLSSVTAAPDVDVVADGTQLSTITVRVVDVNGNVLPGQAVQLAASGTLNTLTQPGPTGNQGMASGTLASTRAETKTVSAIVNPGPGQVALDDTPSVRFIADASAISDSLSTVTVNPPDGVIADGLQTSTVRVTVRDVNGNPVQGQAVSVAASGVNNTLTQPGNTNSGGVATGFLASTTAEVKTISVTVNPGAGAVQLLAQPTITFVGDPATISATLSNATATPGSDVVADGVAVSTIDVVVRDVNGNPVPGQALALSASGVNNTLVQPGPTDAAGAASGTLASTSAALKTVTITVNPGAGSVQLADQPLVRFIGDAANISASLSTAVAQPPSGVVADGVDSSDIRVIVRDVNGNGVPGRVLQLAATGSNNVLTQPPVSDIDGLAVGSIASTTAETKTVSVTVDPGGAALVLDDMPTVSFDGNPGSISDTLSSVSAAPAIDVVADGVSVSTITVVVRDTLGNPVSGQVVQLSSSGSANSLTQPALTDATGTTTGTLASTRAEQKLVTAVVDPGAGQVQLADQPSVDFIGDAANLSAALSDLDVDPTSGLPADGVTAALASITVRDVNGNAVGGVPVELRAGGSGTLLVQPAPSDAAGATQGSLASTTAERKILRAVLDPGPGELILPGPVAVDFVWARPNTYYVRISGSDVASGTSPDQAWRTLQRATSSTVAGDTVYVGAGIYLGTVTVSTGGTPAAPVRYVADTRGAFTGDPGLVQLNGQGAQRTLLLNGVSNVIVEGFVVRGATPSPLIAGGAIQVDGGQVQSNIVLRRNTIYASTRGIWAAGVTGLVLEGNRISEGSGVSAPDAGIRVEQCDASVVRGNLIYDNGGPGVSVVSSNAIEITNNTLYLNAGDQLLVTGSSSAVSATNNVLAMGFSDGLEVEAGSTVTNSFNLIWGHGGVDYAGIAAPGASEFALDPMFVNPPGPDGMLGGAQGVDDRFELSSAPPSPAIDAGSATGAALPLSDGRSLADTTTRIDSATDAGIVDLGLHRDLFGAALSKLADDDLRLFYAALGQRALRVRTWDDSSTSWSGALAAPPTGVAAAWSVTETSPLENDEELALVLTPDSAGRTLSALSWDGSEWRIDWRVAAPGSAGAERRDFDLAYEATSGTALAVWSDGSPTPRYRLREQGVWGDVLALPLNDGGGPNPDTNSGAVLWIELESRPGSDQLAVAFADANGVLVAAVWDGTQWSTQTADTLEAGLATNPNSNLVDNRAFDLAWEENSGDLVAAWGRAGFMGFVSSNLVAGQVGWTAPQLVPVATLATGFVDLASEPGSNRVALAGVDLGSLTEGLVAAVWSGAAWLDVSLVDGQVRDMNDLETGDFPAAAAWAGGSGTAVVVYADQGAMSLDWASWSGAGWGVGSDVVLPTASVSTSLVARSMLVRDALMVVMADDGGRLFGATFNGTTWAATFGAAPLESSLAAQDSVPFALSVKK